MTDPERLDIPAVSLDAIVSKMVAVPPPHHPRRVTEPSKPLIDVPVEVRRALAPTLERLQVGDSVAIAMASQAIAHLDNLMAAVIKVMIECGTRPFIVSPNESKAGLTPESRRLEGLSVHCADTVTGADHFLVITGSPATPPSPDGSSTASPRTLPSH